MHSVDLDPLPEPGPRGSRLVRLAGLVAVVAAAVLAVAEPALARKTPSDRPHAVGDLVRLKGQTHEGEFRIVGRGTFDSTAVGDWLIRSVRDRDETRYVSTMDIEAAR